MVSILARKVHLPIVLLIWAIEKVCKGASYIFNRVKEMKFFK
jgi:hypothetical protein